MNYKSNRSDQVCLISFPYGSRCDLDLEKIRQMSNSSLKLLYFQTIVNDPYNNAWQECQNWEPQVIETLLLGKFFKLARKH